MVIDDAAVCRSGIDQDILLEPWVVFVETIVIFETFVVIAVVDAVDAVAVVAAVFDINTFD